MKRFRWTRKTFRQARRLARFFSERTTLPDEAPPLLQRYTALMDRHPQHDDPLAGLHWERMSYLRSKHGPDDIPF